MNKCVLITGCNGFTGKHLSDHLTQNGYIVLSLQADITDFSMLDTELRALACSQQIDYVIHLAAVSFVAHSNTLDFYRVNVLGSENLLNALCQLESPPKKVILASSAAVYGTHHGVELLNESLCPRPQNHYGYAKLAMEQLAQTYQDKLPILVTRPFNYTGIGQAESFVIPKLIAHFKEKAQVIALGNLQVWREFNDVADVCDWYQQLLENPQALGQVNLCSQRLVALQEVIEMLHTLTNYYPQIQTNPALVRANELPRLGGDAQKLHQWIQARPTRTLQQTLEAMLKSH
ncbi:UDP-glucose 4-epimerase [Thiosulfatimonas sediminis]|uniref:UDP-glucose 4-epimerase n=1 Tax=Thiosulfatimonas sediminis TaxID=2675054 RepID=A0A6F8PSX7_9GAMM|nr:NAD-dependent epimerase/dehydratase family protein [Thiosulfatimonas sediminis]BBP45090.1 UDP-glucose 4-epimerase [Thiosulfatimonas sediminis]